MAVCNNPQQQLQNTEIGIVIQSWYSVVLIQYGVNTTAENKARYHWKISEKAMATDTIELLFQAATHKN